MTNGRKDFRLSFRNYKTVFANIFLSFETILFHFSQQRLAKISNTKIFREFFAEKIFPAFHRLPTCLPGRFRRIRKTPQGILHTPFRAKDTFPAG